MNFPTTRLRRLRQSDQIREMVAETKLSPSNLIQPLFIREDNQTKEISSMPGIYQYGLEQIGAKARELQDLGLTSVILFGIPNKKDALGSEAYNHSGVIQKAITEVREMAPKLTVIADCCLCEYTDHGHCGPIKNGAPDNDLTLELLQKTATSQAAAGAHMIAPSGMIDGMVGSIRSALDKDGFNDTIIMSYSTKYASSFYGPFREAAGSKGCFTGDRKSHQMDMRNSLEALRESEQDIREGADILMVKPALSYLDIISKIKEEFKVPMAAYNVSGEYSMIKAASEKGWIDETKAINEVLTSIKRAGADLIITYFAEDFIKKNNL